MSEVTRSQVRETYAFADISNFGELVPGRQAGFDEWLRSELERAYAWGATDMQAECNGAGYATNPFTEKLV